MRLVFFFLLLSFSLNGQITKNTYLHYTSGVPSHTPSAILGDLAYDNQNDKLYFYDGASWKQFVGWDQTTNGIRYDQGVGFGVDPAASSELRTYQKNLVLDRLTSSFGLVQLRNTGTLYGQMSLDGSNNLKLESFNVKDIILQSSQTSRIRGSAIFLEQINGVDYASFSTTEIDFWEPLNMNTNVITGVGTPSAGTDAVNLNYLNNTYSNADADADASNELIETITLNGTDLSVYEGSATTTVDLSSLQDGTGTDNQDIQDVLSQGNNTAGTTITGLPIPSLDTDAATKKYVDDNTSTSPWTTVGSNIRFDQGIGIGVDPPASDDFTIKDKRLNIDESTGEQALISFKRDGITNGLLELLPTDDFTISAVLNNDLDLLAPASNEISLSAGSIRLVDQNSVSNIATFDNGLGISFNAPLSLSSNKITGVTPGAATGEVVTYDQIDNEFVTNETDPVYIGDPASSITSSGSNQVITDTERTKLNGIAAGAEVNVQSDWDALSGDAFIKNKPTDLGDFTNTPGYVTTSNDADADANNEIQNLDEVLTQGNNAGGKKLVNVVPGTLTGEVVTYDQIDDEFVTTESDPIYGGDPASGIVAQDITNWDAAHSWGDHALANYLTSESQTLSSILTSSTNAGANQITNLADGTASNHAATVGQLNWDYTGTTLSTDVGNWANIDLNTGLTAATTFFTSAGVTRGAFVFGSNYFQLQSRNGAGLDLYGGSTRNEQVDIAGSTILLRSGNTTEFTVGSGSLNAHSNIINNVGTPSIGTDAANKSYVDNNDDVNDADASITNETITAIGMVDGELQIDEAGANQDVQILPSGGSANQVLSTNGSGVYSWVNDATGTSPWTTETNGIRYNSGIGLGTLPSSTTQFDLFNKTITLNRNNDLYGDLEFSDAGTVYGSISLADVSNNFEIVSTNSHVNLQSGTSKDLSIISDDFFVKGLALQSVARFQPSAIKFYQSLDMSNNKITDVTPGGAAGEVVTYDQIDNEFVTSESDPIYGSDPASSITNAGSGIVTSATERTNWNAAFGWGDHAAVGYITSQTDDQTASEVSISPAISGLAATDVRAALIEMQNANEINVSAITGLAATDVQAAIAEIHSDVDGITTPFIFVDDGTNDFWYNTTDAFGFGASPGDGNEFLIHNLSFRFSGTGNNFDLGSHKIINVANATLGTDAMAFGQHTWGNLTGIPAGFQDGIDNVNDADFDSSNEIQDLLDVLGVNPSAGSLEITDLAEPSLPQSAATKNYVDTNDDDTQLTDAEVKTAYWNEVPAATQVEAEAGTSQAIRRWTPERVKQSVLANQTDDQTLSEVLSNGADAGGVGVFNMPSVASSGNLTLSASGNDVFITGDLLSVSNGGTGFFTANPTEMEVNVTLEANENAFLDKNLTVGRDAGASTALLEFGGGRTADGHAFIDLIGDASAYDDYGLRLIRWGTGGSAGISQLSHRGTTSFQLRAIDGGPVIIASGTNNVFHRSDMSEFKKDVEVDGDMKLTGLFVMGVDVHSTTALIYDDFDVSSYDVGMLKIETTNSGNMTYTGFLAQEEGAIIRLYNDDPADNVILSHESTFSAAANRIVTISGSDKTCSPGDIVTLIYLDGKWREF